jgi:hypothetical protein
VRACAGGVRLIDVAETEMQRCGMTVDLRGHVTCFAWSLMSQQEAARLAREAKDRVSEALVLLSLALSDPGPAAGPRAAIAQAPLEAASQLLDHAADELGETDVYGLRGLSRDAAARGREAVAVAFIPWPFVYTGIGPLLNGVRALQEAIPQIIALEPVPTLRPADALDLKRAARGVERNLELVGTLAPALRDTLDMIEAIDAYPVPSRTALLNTLGSDTASKSLPRLPRERLESLLLPEMFPISDKQELAQRLYPLVSVLQANHHGTVGPAKQPDALARDPERWTKVAWASLAAGTYRFDFTLNGAPKPDTWLRWRRYSAFPPWYTEGAHNTRDPFNAIFVCDPYCDFWFGPVHPGVHWSISGHLSPCLGFEVRE